VDKADVDEGRKERRKHRSTREKVGSTSGGSDERREKRGSRAYVNGDDYPIMTFDGRPEMKRTESKRRSFLGGFL
jgi:hypothetical protein